MAWQEREPSVKLTMDTSVFNILVDILNFNSQIDLTDTDFADVAKRLKDKLLTYSVPKLNDEKEERVDVRFFPREASDMIWQLLIMNKPKDDIEDYYSILKANREARKKR